MVKFFGIIIVTLLFAVFISCVSPLDVDADRRGYALNGIKLQPSITGISFSEGNEKSPFIVNKNLAYIDTSVTPPAFWLDMTLENTKYGLLDEIPRISAEEINIKFDSLLIDNQNFQLSEAFVKGLPVELFVKLRRDSRNIFDTTVVCGINGNDAKVDIQFDQENKKITTKFDIMIHINRAWYEYKDTVIVNPDGFELKFETKKYRMEPDSLIISGTLDLIYQ
jgi:hypothetical protein